MANRQAVLRYTLTRIQDMLAEETGAPLPDAAQARLQSILSQALGTAPSASDADAFTSRQITMLLADLRGFSVISEAYPSDTVLELLRPYFATMTEIVVRHRGTIDKVTGDSVMALFDETRSRDGARRAVACAVDMQLAMDRLNQDCRQRSLPELHMGIGLNTGTVMAGLIGSGDYSEYAVIGGEVNLASRIEAFALRGQILISQSTYERCEDFVLTEEPIDVLVKGKSEPVSLREVTAIPSLGKKVPRKEIRRSLRVKAEFPFVYRIVKDKIVGAEPSHGRILEIGYYGVKAELDRDLSAYSELKMEIDLSLVGYVASDIYARVLRLRPSASRYVASIEFTSLSEGTQAQIRRLVQLLVQGSEGN
jgi:adenylate cyclase